MRRGSYERLGLVVELPRGLSGDGGSWLRGGLTFNLILAGVFMAAVMTGRTSLRTHLTISRVWSSISRDKFKREPLLGGSL